VHTCTAGSRRVVYPVFFPSLFLHFFFYLLIFVTIRTYSFLSPFSFSPCSPQKFLRLFIFSFPRFFASFFHLLYCFRLPFVFSLSTYSCVRPFAYFSSFFVSVSSFSLYIFLLLFHLPLEQFGLAVTL
jgi:hypothetical protein